VCILVGVDARWKQMVVAHNSSEKNPALWNCCRSCRSALHDLTPPVISNNRMTSADKHIRVWTFTHEGYPKALRRSTLPSPPGPAATEIHVRVKAAALNPVDIQLMNLPVWRYIPESLVPSDKGIGEDFSGVVEAAGKHSRFDIGDEVRYCTQYTIH
jgi:hypothetical protein